MKISESYHDYSKYLGVSLISKPSCSLTIPSEKVYVMSKEDHKVWKQKSKRFRELFFNRLIWKSI